MKRLLALLVVLSPLCVLVSGCGGCSPVGSKPIVVEQPTGEKLQKMTEAMKAEQDKRTRESQTK